MGGPAEFVQRRTGDSIPLADPFRGQPAFGE